MSMEEWVKIISTVGFPIAITAYLLMRLENIIKELTGSVNKLIIVLARKGIDIDLEDRK